MIKGWHLIIAVVLHAAVLTAGDKPVAPVRVVSLGPSITEIIYQLKQESCLVGRSSACDYPAAAAKLPVVGNMSIPFMERLAAVRPDYVLSSDFRDKGVKNTIESLGIKVIILPGRTLQDYVAAVKIIGDVLKCPEVAAAEVTRFNRQLTEFQQMAGVLPEAQRPKVYLEVWHRPLQTCGGKSFINEMIEYAGGVNIATGEPREYFACSEEWILKQNPEVIIAPGMGSGKSGQIKSRRGWSEVSAVKQNRIYTGLDQSAIFRLGPRTVEGIAILRGCITGSRTENTK